jgi:hypothetical protein
MCILLDHISLTPPRVNAPEYRVKNKVRSTPVAEFKKRRRDNLNLVFETFKNFREILSLVHDFVLPRHGRTTAENSVLYLARFLNFIDGSHIGRISVSFANKSTQEFEIDLVYIIANVFVHTGSSAISSFLAQCKDNAGYTLVCCLEAVCEYLVDKFACFNWVSEKPVADVFVRLKVYQTTTLDSFKKVKQRQANEEEKISKERDFLPAQHVIDFLESKNGKVLLSQKVSHSLNEIFLLSLNSTGTANFITIRQHIIGLLNIGLVASRVMEFSTLRICDLFESFETILQVGLVQAQKFFFVATGKHKTVGFWGKKTLVFPPCYMFVLLVYVVRVLKVMDAPEQDLMEYLSTSRKFLFRPFNGIQGSRWGSEQFTKITDDFSKYMEESFSLKHITVQAWRKAYSTLGASYSFEDEKIRQEIVNLISRGGCHTPFTMRRYYCMMEGRKAALKNAEYRQIFLGEFAHLDFEHRDLIVDFLRSLNVSEACLNSVALFYSSYEFSLDVCSESSDDELPSSVGCPDSPDAENSAGDLNSIFGTLSNTRGNLCWLNSLIRLLQRVLTSTSLKYGTSEINRHMIEILADLESGKTLELSDLGIALKKFLPDSSDRDQVWRASGDFLPLILAELPIADLFQVTYKTRNLCKSCKEDSGTRRENFRFVTLCSLTGNGDRTENDLIRLLTRGNSTPLVDYRCSSCNEQSVYRYTAVKFQEATRYILFFNDHSNDVNQLILNSECIQVSSEYSLAILGFSLFRDNHYVTYTSSSSGEGRVYLKFDDSSISTLDCTEYLKELKCASVILFEIV